MRFKLPPFLLWFLVAAVLSACFKPAQAQVEEDYVVIVTVPDQSDAARDAAMRAALGIMINRISGEQAANNVRVRPLLGRAAGQVKQYGYETNDKDETQLVITFDQPVLDAGLHTLGLPVWGMNAAAVNEIALSISGINTPQAYARAMSTLRTQPGVKNVSVSEISNGVLHLRVNVEGGAQRLAGAISISKVLKRADSSDVREMGFVLVN